MFDPFDAIFQYCGEAATLNASYRLKNLGGFYVVRKRCWLWSRFYLFAWRSDAEQVCILGSFATMRSAQEYARAIGRKND